MIKENIKSQIIESARIKNEMVQNGVAEIEKAAELLISCVMSGGKIYWCGNGGSAADCQHMAAEYVGRFKKERKGYPAIALTVDTSIITSVSNDYSFETIFARQLEALAVPGDLLIAYSTSGNSKNIIFPSVENEMNSFLFKMR